jgi:hypothetical protein
LSTHRASDDRYHKIDHDAATIERLLVELFLEAHKVPSTRSGRAGHG